MRKEQSKKAQYDTNNFESTTATQVAEDLNKIAWRTKRQEKFYKSIYPTLFAEKYLESIIAKLFPFYLKKNPLTIIF